MTAERLAQLLEHLRPRIAAIPGWRSGGGEDLYQTVCAECLRKRCQYKAWTARLVMSIAWNQWRSLQRREIRHAHVALPDTLCSNDSSPESDLEHKERARQLRRALDLLPPNYRMVLWERFWNGLKCCEIAEATGQNADTVKTWSRRAIDELRLFPFVQELHP